MPPNLYFIQTSTHIEEHHLILCISLYDIVNLKIIIFLPCLKDFKLGTKVFLHLVKMDVKLFFVKRVT